MEYFYLQAAVEQRDTKKCRGGDCRGRGDRHLDCIPSNGAGMERYCITWTRKVNLFLHRFLFVYIKKVVVTY